MSSERGSTAIMAITAMLVLAVGSASYAYVANRNVNITAGYADGLQAQYSAEAAVKIIYVAGKESRKTDNGYDNAIQSNSALDDWRLQTTDKSPTKTLPIVLLEKMGSADIKVSSNVVGTTTTYDVQARATVNKARRIANNKGINLIDTNEIIETNIEVTIANLIKSALTIPGKSSFKDRNGVNITGSQWQFPKEVSKPTISPGGKTSDGKTSTAWQRLYSQVLFDDTLGYSNYRATKALQLVFRVNYYATLTDIDPITVNSGNSGYGVFYLAKKGNDVTVDSPITYVVQFDPGITNWGSSSNSKDWPIGAFLVKKFYNNDGAWDVAGDDWQCAFQRNNELSQRYYDSDGGIQPQLDPTHLANDSIYEYKTHNYNYNLWALQDYSLSPRTTQPTVTQVPTAFGFNSRGIFSKEMTGTYPSRPPDLRVAYTLGNIAEGNPWQKNTYYPVGAKVAVGVWADDPIKTRMVWKATKAGVSSNTKPAALNEIPLNTAQVTDRTVQWTAEPAPTPEQVAQSILDNHISIAKISMADLKFRVDNVNGKTSNRLPPYGIPFTMLKDSKNKITIELWADGDVNGNSNLYGNRIHVIKVNDVLMLGFNDKFVRGKYNVIGKGWELNPAADPRSTGLRVWGALAAFYTSDSYGQTMTTTTNSNYGTWGK